VRQNELSEAVSNQDNQDKERKRNEQKDCLVSIELRYGRGLDANIL